MCVVQEQLQELQQFSSSLENLEQNLDVWLQRLEAEKPTGNPVSQRTAC